MKQSLHLNISQHLLLTPQLQQAIRLLQLSTFDLKQEIQNQVESNPMLESTPNEELEELPVDSNTDDEFSDFQWSNLYITKNQDKNFNEDHFNIENLHTTPVNLQNHLNWQLELTPMTSIDRAIATAIIDAIDDNGFLTCSLSDLHKSLTSKDYPLSLAEIEAVRHRIQQFDPIGCGVISLAEELLIQLNQLPKDTPFLALAKKIVNKHVHLLAKHDYRQLMNIYDLNEQTLEGVIHLILQLNPKPGSLIDQSQPEMVYPDLSVKKIGRRWHVALNANTLPHLSINTYYTSLIKQAKSRGDCEFLKYNLQEARWFLKSIKSRQETLLKVARYIVNYQKDFLELGDEAMKPLVLNQVADALDMHESTVSRVTTQKFISTPRGLFELKYFFSNRISTSKGGDSSSIAIRALIKKMLAEEDHNKPLSDIKIAEIMNKQGVNIARRTVAKYRELMGIPPSSQRRAMKEGASE